MFLAAALRGAAGTHPVGRAGLLRACGGDIDEHRRGGTTPGGAADFGTLDYQLSWIKNVEFAGPVHRRHQGLLQGRPASRRSTSSPAARTSSQDSVVAAGKAFVGISAPDITGAGHPQGRAARRHRRPVPEEPVLRHVAWPSTPITDARGHDRQEDRRAGHQRAGLERVPQGQQHRPVEDHQGAGPVRPAAAGPRQVDGWFSFFTNEPNLLKTKGIDTVECPAQRPRLPAGLRDLRRPARTRSTKTATRSRRSSRPTSRAGATRINDPALGRQARRRRTTARTSASTEAEQTLESKAQNTLIVDRDTKANGLFTDHRRSWSSETIETLALGGSSITAEQLFDLSRHQRGLRGEPEPQDAA